MSIGTLILTAWARGLRAKLQQIYVTVSDRGRADEAEARIINHFLAFRFNLPQTCSKNNS
jgi:hypothetical protein